MCDHYCCVELTEEPDPGGVGGGVGHSLDVPALQVPGPGLSLPARGLGDGDPVAEQLGAKGVRIGGRAAVVTITLTVSSLELQTEVCEYFTITEKARTKAFSWLKPPASEEEGERKPYHLSGPSLGL